MRMIGVTGGTGSGKSVVTAMLAEQGAFVVDADAISHQVILKGEEPSEGFGIYSAALHYTIGGYAKRKGRS